MGTSIVVNSSNFETEVTQRSHEKPVVIDFYATWCGPCQMLKPILEKLVQEYDFVLAKVDIDQEPALANAFGVEGVPDVRVVVEGRTAPGFVGVLPEPKVREFLTDTLNLKSDLEMGLDAIRGALAAGHLDEAQQRFAALIERYPDDRRLILEAARFLIGRDRLESAEKLLSVIQENEKGDYAKAQALKRLSQLKRELASPVGLGELDQIYAQAAMFALDEDYEAALQGFLQIVERDRTYRQDGGRKAMLMVFDLLGDDHPLSKEYRKKLMLTLY